MVSNFSSVAMCICIVRKFAVLAALASRELVHPCEACIFSTQILVGAKVKLKPGFGTLQHSDNSNLVVQISYLIIAVATGEHGIFRLSFPGMAFFKSYDFHSIFVILAVDYV